MFAEYHCLIYYFMNYVIHFIYQFMWLRTTTKEKYQRKV